MHMLTHSPCMPPFPLIYSFYLFLIFIVLLFQENNKIWKFHNDARAQSRGSHDEALFSSKLK